jgi:hypothetical protein
MSENNKSRIYFLTLLLTLTRPAFFSYHTSLVVEEGDSCLDSRECRECVRGKCLRCRGGYRNLQNLCTPVKVQLPKCVSYLFEGFCIECQRGYYDQNGRCIKCSDKNCALCPSNTCIACFNKVKFEKSCEATACSLPNCRICLFNDLCDVCDKGFALRKIQNKTQESFECVPNPNNCLIVFNDSDKCSACDIDRVLNKDCFCVNSISLLYYTTFYIFKLFLILFTF